MPLLILFFKNFIIIIIINDDGDNNDFYYYFLHSWFPELILIIIMMMMMIIIFIGNPSFRTKISGSSPAVAHTPDEPSSTWGSTTASLNQETVLTPVEIWTSI